MKLTTVICDITGDEAPCLQVSDRKYRSDDLYPLECQWVTTEYDVSHLGAVQIIRALLAGNAARPEIVRATVAELLESFRRDTEKRQGKAGA
jgi:hypothetical protein